MKVYNLKGRQLNWAVRQCLNPGTKDYVENRDNFSDCWNKAGPIIEREKIGLVYNPHCLSNGGWYATSPKARRFLQLGETPLIAAMRCYVASKLGEDIDIPETLK